MNIKENIREIAKNYREKLDLQIQTRMKEMKKMIIHII